jgi:hypothetical protein
VPHMNDGSRRVVLNRCERRTRRETAKHQSAHEALLAAGIPVRRVPGKKTPRRRRDRQGQDERGKRG